MYNPYGCPRHAQMTRGAAVKRASRDPFDFDRQARHEPTTIALSVAAIASVAAAGVGAYSSIQQGQAASAAAEYNARMGLQRNEFNHALAEYNARLAESQGEYAMQRADYEMQAVDAKAKSEERLARIKGDQTRGSIRSRVGASGVTTEGSPLMVLMETAREEQMDVEQIRYGAALEKFGIQTDASLAQREAKERARAAIIGADFGDWDALANAGIERFRGRGAKTASYYNAGSSLLTGASSAANSYYNYKKT